MTADHEDPSDGAPIAALKAVIAEFHEAQRKFAAAKRSINPLPEWAEAFWPATDRQNIRLVSGAALGTYIEELSWARERWRKLAAQAPGGVPLELLRDYFDRDTEIPPRDFVMDSEGRVDERDLIVSGEVKGLLSIDLFLFRLRDCLVDGDLSLGGGTIDSGLLLERVNFMVSPSRVADVEGQQAMLFDMRMVSNRRPHPGQLRAANLFMTGAQLGSLKLDRVSAYGIVADGATVSGDVGLFMLDVVELELSRFTCKGFCEATRRVHVTQCRLEDAVFERPADFSGAQFGALSGSRVQFKQTALFRATRFASAPLFHDASFSTDTDFHDAVFGDATRGDRPGALSSRGAFRALRLAMAKAKAHDEEMRFFQAEQRATRQLMSFVQQPVTKFLSYAYDLISCYGNAPGQALAAFIIWNATFGIVFAGISAAGPWLYSLGIGINGYVLGFPVQPAAIEVTPDSVFSGAEALGLAVQNAINPLALVTSSPLAKIHRGGLFLLSAVQSIGAVGIGALFLLAVRNRFQRGAGG